MKALPVFFASLLLSCATAGAAQMPVPTPAPPPALQPAPTPPPPSITGSAWLLMDYATGQVLAGDNIAARVEPASRSEGRRVGHGCVSTCKSRRSPSTKQQKKISPPLNPNTN